MDSPRVRSGELRRQPGRIPRLCERGMGSRIECGLELTSDVCSSGDLVDQGGETSTSPSPAAETRPRHRQAGRERPRGRGRDTEGGPEGGSLTPRSPFHHCGSACHRRRRTPPWTTAVDRPQGLEPLRQSTDRIRAAEACRPIVIAIESADQRGEHCASADVPPLVPPYLDRDRIVSATPRRCRGSGRRRPRDAMRRPR